MISCWHIRRLPRKKMKTPREMILDLGARLLADPARVAGFDATYALVLEGEGGGVWNLRCRPPVGFSEGEGASDCRITVASCDFAPLVSGELNPQVAFMQNRLKLSGEISLALRLPELLRLVS